MESRRYLSERREHLHRMDETYQDLLELADVVDTVRKNRWEAAQEMLYGIQSELSDDDRYPLIRVNQRTRGSTTQYSEALTADGVIAVPELDAEPEEYITSSCPEDGRPLPDYLESMHHARGMNTLVERLLQDEDTTPPTVGRTYY